jgi:hypothetical protein
MCRKIDFFQLAKEEAYAEFWQSDFRAVFIFLECRRSCAGRTKDCKAVFDAGEFRYFHCHARGGSEVLHAPRNDPKPSILLTNRYAYQIQ